MNRDCNGEYFQIPDGRKYYRCFRDSTIIPADKAINHDACPNCKRLINCETTYKSAKIRNVVEVGIWRGREPSDEDLSWFDITELYNQPEPPQMEFCECGHSKHNHIGSPRECIFATCYCGGYVKKECKNENANI